VETKQIIDVFRTRILELEDKLMDVIIISNNYEKIPIPIFDQEINSILKEIEYLENLI
jgi:hypothetical protein